MEFDTQENKQLCPPAAKPRFYSICEPPEIVLSPSEDSLSTSSSTSTTSYYDLPLLEDAPECETRICAYLQSHGVRMSHPEAKSVSGMRQSSSFTPAGKAKPSLLLTRRNKGFSHSCRLNQLSIQVPCLPVTPRMVVDNS